MKYILFIFLLVTGITVKAQIPVLNSRPAAEGTLYLDFDGEVVQSGVWNNGNPINCLPANVTNDVIIDIFNRVSEDFKIFNLNVTTDATKYLAAPITQRTRIVITPTNYFFPGVLGVAYMNTFSWGDDTPCFAFQTVATSQTKALSETMSHELGHTLGLAHQALYDITCNYLTAEYNPGQGSGEIGWAPIMGQPTIKSLTTWHNGKYNINVKIVNCNFQDDILTISQKIVQVPALIPDDVPDNIANASNLSIAGINVSGTGLINNRFDIDMFKFTLAGPATKAYKVKLKINTPFAPNNDSYGNIDIIAKILDGSGTVLGTYNIIDLLRADVDIDLNGGSTYYLSVDGTSNANMLDDAGNPSDYGSAGSYTITGTIEPLIQVPVVLSGFTATPNCNPKRVELNWRTTQETNSKHFVIERSTDGSDFMWVTKVAAAGNSSIPKDYVYYDNYPVKGSAFYRLVMVDLNDNFKTSGSARIYDAATKCFTGIQPASVPCASSINGPSDICGINNGYFSLSNVPDYTYINWSLTPSTSANFNKLYSNYVQVSNNGSTGTIALNAIESRCNSGGSVSKNINVAASIPINATLEGNSAFCSNTTLTVNNVPANAGVTIAWSSSNTNIAVVNGNAGTNTATVTGVGNGLCDIIATITPDPNSCYAPATITKQVTRGNPADLSILVWPFNTNLCGGTPFTAETYLEGANSYLWTPPSGLQINSGNGSYQINANITSTPLGGPLQVSATNQCGTVTGVDNLLSPVNFPLPSRNQPYIKLVNALCLSNIFTAEVIAVPNANNYNWRVREFDANGNLLTISPLIITATNQANYSLVNPNTTSARVFVYAATACGNTPTINELFNNCRMARVANLNSVLGLAVTPNPTKGNARITLPPGIDWSGTYELVNVSGGIVRQGRLTGTKSYFEIDLSGLANGFYTLFLRTKTETRQVKIIKE